MKPSHTHRFVENHAGAVAYGLDRETDEATLAVYLQKFSDDALLQTMLPRLDQTEMDALFDMVSALLHKHLVESEYHALFLKDR